MNSKNGCEKNNNKKTKAAIIVKDEVDESNKCVFTDHVLIHDPQKLQMQNSKHVKQEFPVIEHSDAVRFCKPSLNIPKSGNVEDHLVNGSSTKSCNSSGDECDSPSKSEDEEEEMRLTDKLQDSIAIMSVPNDMIPWDYPAVFHESEFRINVDYLISEVEARKVLWDQSIDSYSDRQVKRGAWREVCRALRPDFEEMLPSQQKLLGDTVEKKWRNLRDAFVRSLKDKPNSGNRASKRKKYVYFDQLRFLQKAGIPRSNFQSHAIPKNLPRSNFQSHAIPKSLSGSDATSHSSPVSKNRTSSDIKRHENHLEEVTMEGMQENKRKLSAMEKFVEFLEKQKHADELKQDGGHQQFFESLLPLVQKFDDDQTLHFRAQVIHLIQQIKRGASLHTSHYSPAQSQHPTHYDTQSQYYYPQYLSLNGASPGSGEYACVATSSASHKPKSTGVPSDELKTGDHKLPS